MTMMFVLAVEFSRVNPPFAAVERL